MSKTIAEVEVKKAAAHTKTFIPPTPKVAPAPASTKRTPAEQSQSDSKLFWTIAPLSLLIAGSTTFLVVRRWLNRSAQDSDERLA